MNEIKNFVDNLGLNPFWSIILICLCICVWKYDKVKEIIIDIWVLLAKCFGCCERRATQGRLETICSKGLSSISQETPELELPSLKIKWVAKDDNKIELNDKEAIVFLKFNTDNTQNIINATSAYVRKTVLPISKTYMPSQIREAIDYTVIKKCLLEIPQYRLAANAFISDNQELIRDNQVAIDKVGNIDDAGLMSRILFREYFEWGNRIAGRNIEEKYQQEASDFLEFLYEITSRGYEDNTRLQHISEHIKVGVLLVAKLETFLEQGELPYVRRIKEGFAKGIRTFYLLARNEKVEIVEEVYGKLIQTGDYNLLNGPKVYKDSQGRENICYCIEVDKNGDMAKTYTRIKDAIKNNDILEAVIDAVHINTISCVINNVKIIIPRENITDVPDLKLHHYFQAGMSIEFVPEKINERGNIIGSLLQTNSNPQKLINSQFSVGNEVIAIVEKTDDNCLFLRVKDSEMQGIAFRKDITYSHYIFLHKQFYIGSEHKFKIIDIDYISNRLHLQLADLSDPWNNLRYTKGQELTCKVYQKQERCIVTEVEEGVKAILPITETAWFESDFIPMRQFKLNEIFSCRIKSINKDERLVVLTMKSIKSPYLIYYEKLNEQNYILDAQIIASNVKGIICLAEDRYRIFIPQSETHINQTYYSYKLKQKIKVYIKEVNKDGRSFIGSLKPFIEHPMQWFYDNYKPGMCLSYLEINTINETSVLFNIKKGKTPYCYGLLPIKEITNLCRINSLKQIFNGTISFPLIVTDIDMEQCLVKLSLKQLLENNKDRIGTIDYNKQYNAYIIGKHDNDSVIILENVWIEGVLIDSPQCHIGDRISVRALSLREIPEFIED